MADVLNSDEQRRKHTLFNFDEPTYWIVDYSIVLIYKNKNHKVAMLMSKGVNVNMDMRRHLNPNLENKQGQKWQNNRVFLVGD